MWFDTIGEARPGDMLPGLGLLYCNVSSLSIGVVRGGGM